MIAAAGPIASLLLGIVFLAIEKFMRGQGFSRYLTLWLGLFGVALFMGYLLTPPFYTKGDIYTVLDKLNLASPVFIGTSVLIGAAGIVQMGRIGAPRLLALTNPLQPLRPQMLALGLFAWLLGSILVLTAMFPRFPWMLVAIGTFAPLTNFFAARRDPAQSYGEPSADPRFSIVGMGLFLLMAAMEHTVLLRGVRL